MPILPLVPDPLSPVQTEILEIAGTSVRARLYPDLLLPPSAWSNRSPTPQNHWVLVLSGGGAKGAFQVGATQQLYRLGYWPRGVAATSVGSVNALGIAERSWAGLDKLAQTWLSIDSVADAYAAERWVEQVSNLRTLNVNMLSMVYGSASRSLAVDPDATGPGTIAVNRKIDGLANGLISASWLAGTILLPFVPFLTPFVAMEIDDLRDDIRALNTILGREAKGLFNFGPLRRMVEPLIDPRAIADAGMAIRLVMVSLDSQRVCAVDERGELFEYVWQPRELTHRRNAIGPTGGIPITQETLMTAALASAAVPVVNSPVALSTSVAGWSQHAGWMVDGGVRQILPTDQGLEMLEALPSAPGVRKGIIAIGAGAVHPQAPGPPELATPPFGLTEDYRFLDIISTSFFSALDEINTDELARIRRLPDEIDRLVVMPGMPVGGLTQLDPGLVQILMAYGWMRAFDAVTASTRHFDDPAYQNFLWGPTEHIIALRLACWRLEREARSFANEYGFELAQQVPPELSPLSSAADETRAAAARDWETFKRELPAQEAFPIEIKVGAQRFGAAPSTDLIARIRRLKLLIETAVRQRVTMHGLDSLPSVHELSHPSAGNRNAFADWSLEWERHGLAPRTFPPPYPTGPGLVDPRDGKPRRFARFTDPWGAQKRFGFAGSGRRFTLHAFFDAPMHALQFSETPAAARPEQWSVRNPDYRVVRHEGHIFSPKAKISDRLVPLSLAYRAAAVNNLTTTREQADLPSGFGAPVRLGFVFRPDLPRPSGTVPLWTFYSPSLDDHLTTSDGARFGLEGSKGFDPRTHLLPDYRFERLEGYVFPPGTNPSELTVRLYRWVSFLRTDHVTTSQPAWIPQINGQSVENSTNFEPPS